MQLYRAIRSPQCAFWGGLACVLALGLIVTFWNREPTYHAKPFSYWLDQIPCTVTRPNGSVSIAFPNVYHTKDELEAHAQGDQKRADEGLQAVIQVGRNCLPTLLRRIRSKDSQLKVFLMGWAVRLHLIRPPPRNITLIRRGQALTAILKLDSDAKPILPELISLAEDRDPGIRSAARYAVRELSPKDYKRLQRTQAETTNSAK